MAKKVKRRKQADEDREFRRAEKVLAKHWRRLLKRKGVSHVDVNYRTREGKRTSDVVIRVHVEKKLLPEELRASQILVEIDGVPIDVVESVNTYTEQSGSVQGGARIAPQHKLSSAGTLGIVCFTEGLERPRFLTNAHVVYGGKRKRDLSSRIPMLRVPRNGTPTPLGDGLRDQSFRNANGDAALIEPAEGLNIVSGVKDILPNPGGIGVLTRADVRNRVRVLKMGAHTRETAGIVDSVTLTFSVPGFSYFAQIGILSADPQKCFSAFGDSGSVVIKGNKVVGLLHGVTNNGRIAVACHMNIVADRFGVKL